MLQIQGPLRGAPPDPCLPAAHPLGCVPCLPQPCSCRFSMLVRVRHAGVAMTLLRSHGKGCGSHVMSGRRPPYRLPAPLSGLDSQRQARVLSPHELRMHELPDFDYSHGAATSTSGSSAGARRTRPRGRRAGARRSALEVSHDTACTSCFPRAWATQSRHC